MKDIGTKIKFFRNKLGMTQNELAKGIISSSYLSKIENGNTDADPEVIGLLCKRLKISPHLSEFESDTRMFRSWLKSLLDGNKERATHHFDEIMTNANFFSNEITNLIEINKLRYYILINDKHRASRQISLLERRSNKFDLREEYYWTKFRGEYCFFKKYYGESLQFFQKANRLNPNNLFFKELEEAELSYLIALAASKMRQKHLVLLHAAKSLSYFQSTYNLYKCAQCHILLGITYRRIDNVEEARKSYELAHTIAESISDKKILSQCFQNLGALYSFVGEPLKAIDYYKASYESRTDQDLKKLLVPISSLIKEYFKLEDLTNAKRWLQKGLEITSPLNEETSFYVLEFKVYKQLIYDKNSPSLEKLLIGVVLPFLEKKNLHHLTQNYQRVLADYYYRNKKYKSAADYYIKANQSLTLIYSEEGGV